MQSENEARTSRYHYHVHGAMKKRLNIVTPPVINDGYAFYHELYERLDSGEWWLCVGCGQGDESWFEAQILGIVNILDVQSYACYCQGVLRPIYLNEVE